MRWRKRSVGKFSSVQFSSARLELLDRFSVFCGCLNAVLSRSTSDRGLLLLCLFLFFLVCFRRRMRKRKQTAMVVVDIISGRILLLVESLPFFLPRFPPLVGHFIGSSVVRVRSLEVCFVFYRTVLPYSYSLAGWKWKKTKRLFQPLPFFFSLEPAT